MCSSDLHRVWKWQPGGGLAGDGMSPSNTMRVRSRCATGLGTGIASGPAHRPVLRLMSVAMWVLYGAVAFAVGVRRVDPVRVAYASIGAFCILLLTVGLVERVMP